MPKRKTTFTPTHLESLTSKSERYEVTDSEVRQMVLRVAPSGHKAWYLRYRDGAGRTLKAKIDDLSVLTPDEARAEAKLMLQDVAKGTDPVEAKRVRKATALTLEGFIDGDYGNWASANRKDGARNVPRLKAAFKELLPLPLKDITARDVEKWRAERVRREWAEAGEQLKEAEKKKAKAKTDADRDEAARKAAKAKDRMNRSRASGGRDIALLKACLSRAVQFGHILENPLRGAHGVKLAKVDRKSTIRAITPAEEKRLFEELVKREDDKRAGKSHNKWLRGAFTDYLRPYITVLLHTGLRRNEGFQLRWGDVDLDEAELKVRAEVAKSGRERIVPLNPVALETLKTWRGQHPEARPEDSVFSSPQTGDPLTHINTAWRNITKKAGLQGLRLHDLRHTFASRALQYGATISEVQELLGHQDINTTSIYLHTSREGKRRAVDALDTPPAENVVPFAAPAEAAR